MKRELTVALVGNPNVGKTAILNALTGSKAKVGNWPGVTVEKKEGICCYRGIDLKFIDLPGIYSLTSYTIEERVTRNFLLNEPYDVVVDVVDATLLARNLYLTLELLEMGIKPVIALNKIDEVGDYFIDYKRLKEILGLPVVPVSVYKNVGLDTLKEKIIEAGLNGISKSVFLPSYSNLIEAAIKELEFALKKLESLPYRNLRWVALKLLEKDPECCEKLKAVDKSGEVLLLLNKIREEFVNRVGEDISEAISKERFLIASNIAKQVIKVEKSDSSSIRDKLDEVLTTPLTGIPIFFLIMGLVFKITFSFSAPFIDLISSFFENLAKFVESFSLPSILVSLLSKGVIPGVGSVLSFLPILLFLYVLLSILEDSGYMARAAALWDNFMRKFGLSGASVIPLILGFGCNVPAVYATRAMRSPFKKLLTILIIPWISCGARLPVYTLFTAAFFREYETLVVLSLYMLGISVALLFAKILSSFFEGEDDEFFIELPDYKIPSLKVVLNQVSVEIKDFISKAGTVILFASIVVWALASFPAGVDYAGKESLAGILGAKLLPIFKPLGIDRWEPIVALIFGAGAKEIVVGTLGTLFGSKGNLIDVLRYVFTPASALSYMVFVLLYIPCFATIGAIYQESGSKKWTAFIVLVELVVAWVLAFLVYRLALLVF